MGRTQAFNTTAVVQAARDVFWDKGYEAVSVSDLEQATGLGRSSLYHAFESKRGLFNAAIEDYLDTVIRPRLHALDAEPDGHRALTAYFETLAAFVAASSDDSSRRGCLLVNCAAGFGAHDEAVRDAVESYRLELSAAFSRALTRLSEPLCLAELEARTRLLTSLSISAFVLARVNRDEALAMLESARAQVGPAHT